MTTGTSAQSPISKRLEGKVAIITGGASGIGESTARLFTQHGAKVVVADINDELGRALSDELGATFVHCDVTSESDVEALVDLTVAKHGGLDIMYSNAGISGDPEPSVLDAGAANFRRVLDVNVLGAFHCAKHAARAMAAAGRGGAILFTSSVASENAGESPHAYAASKHAVVGLMKNLCVELGQQGIRVNSVAPCQISTPLLRGALGGIEKAAADELIRAAAVLSGQAPGADDVAEAALFLASDEAKYVNGVNLMVDGGYSTTNRSFSMVLRNYIISQNTNFHST